MNREILFKAKRKDWKKLPKENWWVEGDLIQNNFDGMKRMWISSENFDRARLRSVHKYITEWRAIEIDPDTLCKYTGLTDKNGRKIWENDIVGFQFDNDDCPFPNKDTKKRIGKIFFSDFRVSWSIAMGRKGSKTLNNDLFRYAQNGNRVEVIGNIFDNADLLEVE